MLVEAGRTLPEIHRAASSKDSRTQLETTLADSLMVYGEPAGNNNTLRKGTSYYQNALLELTRDRVPFDWATPQNKSWQCAENTW
jgi:hypothetical protein